MFGIFHSSTVYAIPYVGSECKFLGRQDFDPFKQIPQIDRGWLRQFGVLAVVKNVLQANEHSVLNETELIVVVYAMTKDGRG